MTRSALNIIMHFEDKLVNILSNNNCICIITVGPRPRFKGSFTYYVISRGGGGLEMITLDYGGRGVRWMIT